MRYLFVFISVFFLTFNSCKKDNKQDRACFTDTTNTRQIVHEQATIKLSGSEFYMYEEGTIDTKLIPCNLPIDFQVDNLQVTISGYSKSSKEGWPACCTEILVITKITR
ncbi:MAG: hypothetical protein ABI594_03350 [Ginsengibacter sp.]